MMTELQAEMEFRCSVCELTLTVKHRTHKNGVEYFDVQPCKSCLEDAKSEAIRATAQAINDNLNEIMKDARFDPQTGFTSDPLKWGTEEQTRSNDRNA